MMSNNSQKSLWQKKMIWQKIIIYTDTKRLILWVDNYLDTYSN